MNDTETRTLLESVLHQALPSFRGVDIVEKADESGELSLYVDVHLEDRSGQIDLLPVVRQVRQALLDHRDARFPYVHLVFPGDELLIDDTAVPVH